MMSELSRLALLEIIKYADQAESSFISLCGKQDIKGMSARGTVPYEVFRSIGQIKTWAKAIQEERP